MLYSYSGNLYLGLGNWNNPASGFPSGQILVQDSPPNGAWTLETQLPVYDLAVVSMTSVATGTMTGFYAGSWNSNGTATVHSRDYSSRTWIPTYMWNDMNSDFAEVRCLIGYTDPSTSTTYLFAGSDTNNPNSTNGESIRRRLVASVVESVAVF